MLILHVAGGLPDGADSTTTTTVGAALDPARIVADRLRARPATHLLTVAAGEAPLGNALANFAGPNVTVDGQRLLEVSSDDAVAVPSRPLDVVAAELAGDLCATNIRLHAADAAGAVRAKAPLTLEVGDPATIASPAAAATDGEGNLRWRLRSPLGAPLHVSIGDPAAGGKDRVLLCLQSDKTLPVSTTGATLRLEEIVAGAAVVCEMRSVATGAALNLSYGMLAGDVPCSAAVSPAALIAVMGEPVTHCLRVTNPNAVPVSNVVVSAAALGLSADASWTLTEALAPGATAERRVVVLVGRAVAVAVTATGRAADVEVTASAGGSVTPAPVALKVDRTLAADGPVPCAGPVNWCLTVTNTGGTYLDQISVRDAGISATPLSLPGRLAPGERTALGGLEAAHAAALTRPPSPLHERSMRWANR